MFRHLTTHTEAGATQAVTNYDVAVANGFTGTQEEYLESQEGESAYEIAVEEGFTGTRQEWLDSLAGDDGNTGASAYQVALANGFVGTQAQWLTSLKGTDGLDAFNFQRIQRSGRIYCYTDNRWVVAANNTYGEQYVQINANGGLNADPNASWGALGHLLTPDQKVRGLALMGRANNNEVEDIEFYVEFINATDMSRITGDGYDNVAELTKTLVTRGTMYGTTPPVASTDIRITQVGIDFDVPETGILVVSFKPIGTFTATRYFYMNIAVDTITTLVPIEVL